MNTLYKNTFYYIFFVLSIVVVSLNARVRTIQSGREFDVQVSKSKLLMVLFYDGGNKKESRTNQDKMGSFFRMYETVSSKKLYDDADIVFTKLNMKNNAISTIARRYAVTESPC